MTDYVFENRHLIIPLADVQHVEKCYNHKGEFNGFTVITRHTRWDREADTWINNIFVNKDEAEDFKRAWMLYLSESRRDSGRGDGRFLCCVESVECKTHYQMSAFLGRIRDGKTVIEALAGFDALRLEVRMNEQV